MEKWDVYDVNRKKTGKIGIRGDDLNPGEYHIVVFGIIRNSKNQFIVSKRAPEKTWPNTWEITGGAAIVGDTSYSAVLREIKEELNLDIDVQGRLLKTIKIDSECSYFSDIWFFEYEFNVKDIVCQPGEVTEIVILNREDIDLLFNKGEFLPELPYVYEAFDEI